MSTNRKPAAAPLPQRWFVISEIEGVTKVEVIRESRKDAEGMSLYLMHQNPGRWYVQPETQSTTL